MSKQNPITSKLLAWYRRNARDLPWRHTKDPYRIWISEIMLQQTQVTTVVPYYKRWLRAFPTVRKLAGAKLDDVLQHWAGLGYYRRARMIHEAARIITDNHKGKLPSEPEELQKLPGIGRYSAGAIASIAFEIPTPVLDGNVMRILARLFLIRQPIDTPPVQKRLWKIAGDLVPPKDPGDFNQAMMELGATVCLPDQPRCSACPVKACCKGHQGGKPEALPVKKQKVLLTKKRTAALILKRNERVLIEKQPASGRWGGLWMFPHWDSRKAMLNSLDLSSDSFKRKMRIQHGFTRYKIELDVYELSRTPEKGPGTIRRPVTKGTRHPLQKWVAVNKLQAHAFPAPHQKIAETLQKP